MNTEEEKYWTERYRNHQTGWDIGGVSTPIKESIEQLEDTSIKILIPGAGNGYEAEFLHDKGFHNVTVLDISEEPLNNLQERCPTFPSENLIHGDFFSHQGQYDLILEQTFFSAIHPSMRTDYRDQMKNLLRPGGKLVGLLWGVPMNTDHPPYGGSREEYQKLFEGHFQIKVLEECYNSIPPRQGAELFVVLSLW